MICRSDPLAIRSCPRRRPLDARLPVAYSFPVISLLQRWLLRLTAAGLLMALLCTATLSAADDWTRVVGNGTTLYNGFGSSSNIPGNRAVDWLQEFNGNLYAAVGLNESNTGNALSVWRSADAINWSRVGAGVFSNADLDCYSMATDGTRLFAGTRSTNGGANVYITTNGATWGWFNPPGVNFHRPGTIWASHIGVFGSNLLAGVLTTNGSSGQVWQRRTDGSTIWTQVADFATGMGLPGGSPVINANATYFYVVSNTLFMSAGNSLYQTTDPTGAAWVQNTMAGAGFGDSNTLNISSLVAFNGYLYAPTHNVVKGGQLWRTTVANALANGATPWEKVVNNGFGQGNAVTELHHITQGLGWLWITTQSTYAQVWRSSDGTNWVQSNITGFIATNPVTSYKPQVATFGSNVVWGGASETIDTGAQVWTLGPLVAIPSLQIAGTAAVQQVTWPDGALDFTLEVTTNLAPAQWVPATNSVALQNGRKVVTLQPAPGTPAAFYRLRQP